MRFPKRTAFLIVTFALSAAAVQISESRAGGPLPAPTSPHGARSADLLSMMEGRRGPPVQISPAVDTLEMRVLAKPEGDLNAKLLLRTSQVSPTPSKITYLLDNGPIVLKLAKGKDAAPNTYSALIQVDLENMRAQAQAEIAVVQHEHYTPPVRSARFGLLPLGLSSGLAPKIAIANIEKALVDFDNLENSKGEEVPVLKLNRLGGGFRVTLFGLAVPIGTIGNGAPQIVASAIAPNLSLMITDPLVVNDPTRTFDPCTGTGNQNGVWTFKHLVTEMANQSQTGIAPEQFVADWLQTFNTAQTVNTFISAARPNFVNVVYQRWLNNSGGTTLDLNQAPFRLLAIVSRTDLATSTGGYSTSSAGEARLVFGVLDPNNVCGVQQSTVIFEYAIHKTSCLDVHSWVQSWANLSASGLVLGSTYNAALETLTQSFVTANAFPAGPNGGSISQVRTDDLIGGPWTLYEFRLVIPSGSGDELGRVTVKQTPDISFNSNPTDILILQNYIVANANSINNGTYVVPNTVNGTPFLGAEAPVGTNNQHFTWTTTPFPSPPPPATVRSFSINTCNGCHGGDATGSAGNDPPVFTQIKPRAANAASAISDFLHDPAQLATFQDELQRRQQAMADTLNSSCLIVGPIGNSLALATE
jgi:hypothetical protein